MKMLKIKSPLRRKKESEDDNNDEDTEVNDDLKKQSHLRLKEAVGSEMVGIILSSDDEIYIESTLKDENPDVFCLGSKPSSFVRKKPLKVVMVSLTDELSMENEYVKKEVGEILH